MTQPFYCERRDLGLIRVTGADARAFLHAQTTQEINDLASSETRLAAWLSAKGRVRALFDIVPGSDGFWLITGSDSVDSLVDQLGLFVLRSAVEMVAAADSVVYSCHGVNPVWLAELKLILPPGAALEQGGLHWLSPGPSSVIVFGQPDSLAASFPDHPGDAIDRAIHAEIALGRPAVTPALVERYIPQMLNLDLLGAVSFTKGCYPGQEIVARAHNLGEVKRRLKRFSLGPGERPKPGDAIHQTKAQSVGEINRVAATDEGYEILAVVQLNAASSELRLESDGRELSALPLAYES